MKDFITNNFIKVIIINQTIAKEFHVILKIYYLLYLQFDKYIYKNISKLGGFNYKIVVFFLSITL